MPKILDEAVQKMIKQGMSKEKAYPMAVSSLQKAGELVKGSLKLK